MFKSRWQPLPAYVGICGCAFIVLWSGIPPLYILGAKGGLKSSSGLKSSVALACDVLGAYLGVCHPSLAALVEVSFTNIPTANTLRNLLPRLQIHRSSFL